MSSPSIVSKIAHQVYTHQPNSMPLGRWWDHLTTNFHLEPEGFELDLVDQLRVRSTAAFDIGLRTFAASLVGSTALPLAFHPRAFRDGVGDAPMYQQLLDAGRGREFFVEAPEVEFRQRRASGPAFRPEDGQVVDLTYDSPYVPFNPRVAPSYLKHKHNLRGSVRYWRHDGPARPTLVLIHGFVIDAYLLNQWLFQIRWFYEKLGLDVAVFTLPFHGRRQGRVSLFSGHLFFAGGFSWINEAFRQAVMDFRALLNYLRHERGVEQVGVSGISLGGYTTALLASVEPDLAFAIPNVPVVSIPDLALEWEPVGTFCRMGLAATGNSIRDIRHMMAIHCALSYEPLLRPDQLMIVGGVGDRLAPPKHARLLWDHWGRPNIHWFPGNHIIHLDQGGYLRHIARFLDRIDFLPT